MLALGRAFHAVTELVVLVLVGFFGGEALCSYFGWPSEGILPFALLGLSLGVFRVYRILQGASGSE